MSQLFDVYLLVRDEFGQLDGDCYNVYMCFRGQADPIVHFESAYDIAPFCRYKVGIEGIFLDGVLIPICGYRGMVGSIFYDMVTMDYQSVTRLWRLFVDRYAHALSLLEADTFLWQAWHNKTYVDFAIHDHKLDFFNQMYELCGKGQ